MPYTLVVDRFNNHVAIHVNSCRASQDYDPDVFFLHGLKTLEEAKASAVRLGTSAVFRCPLCSPYTLAVDDANRQTTIHAGTCSFLHSPLLATYPYVGGVRLVAAETTEDAERQAKEEGTRFIDTCPICSSKTALLRRSVGLGIAAGLIAGLILGFMVASDVGLWLLAGYCVLLPILGYWVYSQQNKYRILKEVNRLEKLRQSRMAGGH